MWLIETRLLTYIQASATVSQWLMAAEHVHVWCGGMLPSLDRPYEEPYEVVGRQPKFFKLEVRGCQDIVSVERLKPHL